MKVMASGINFADVHARVGLYNGPTGAPSCPAVLGMEGAGVVIETGDDVQDMKVNEIQAQNTLLESHCLLEAIRIEAVIGAAFMVYHV